MSRLLYSRRAIAASAGASLLFGNAHANEPLLSFLVFGDWGKNNEGQRTIATAMASLAAQNTSQFVITTGDNFYDEGVASIRDPLWRTAFEDIYAAPSLQIPWYPVLGNHDHRGSTAAQIAYSTISPRWRMRARYWREDMRLGAGFASFYFLDTTPLTRLPLSGPRLGYVDARAQLQWLERDLAASRATWKIAIGHHTIASGGSHGPDAALNAHLRPLLERHGVAAYFNGHDHNLEHIVQGGVHYVCSGAGASPREITPTADTRFGCADLGFASCALTLRSLSLTFHDAAGASLYAAEIPPAPGVRPDLVLAAGR